VQSREPASVSGAPRAARVRHAEWTRKFRPNRTPVATLASPPSAFTQGLIGTHDHLMLRLCLHGSALWQRQTIRASHIVVAARGVAALWPVVSAAAWPRGIARGSAEVDPADLPALESDAAPVLLQESRELLERGLEASPARCAELERRVESIVNAVSSGPHKPPRGSANRARAPPAPGPGPRGAVSRSVPLRVAHLESGGTKLYGLMRGGGS
jgi:hypothetical protein